MKTSIREYPPLFDTVNFADFGPALALGYSVSDAWAESKDWNSHSQKHKVSDSLLCIRHQTGGYACHGRICMGYLFQLRTNARFAHQELSQLEEAFDALREGNGCPFRPSVAQLKRLKHTSGGCYGNDELLLLSHFLESFFVLPDFRQDKEAWVELYSHRAYELLQDWIMVTSNPNKPLEGVSLLEKVSDFFDETLHFEQTDWDSLLSLGEHLNNKPTNPSLYLLWENCD